jgi:hypothetical protein
MLSLGGFGIRGWSYLDNDEARRRCDCDGELVGRRGGAGDTGVERTLNECSGATTLAGWGGGGGWRGGVAALGEGQGGVAAQGAWAE